MAIKGLSTFLYAPLTDEELIVYGISAKLSGAIEAAPSINYSSVPIYSDNVLKHKDVAFSDGTLSLTVDYADKALLSPLYGRTVAESTFTPTGEGATPIAISKHISNSNDAPVAQGFGYIINDLNVAENKNVYTVRFFYKVEFSPTMETVRTKEGATSYVYSQLNGTIYELPSGDWMEEVDFDTLAVAVEYLESLFVS